MTSRQAAMRLCREDTIKEQKMSHIYKRRANYYETDMMGIVHHSNHIRYFEEARLDYMKSFGCDVLEMEKEGIIIPNVDAYAKYYIPVRFGEEVDIEVSLTTFNGIKMEYTFTMRKQNGELAAEGHTMHCFVKSNFRPISLKKAFPEYYQKLLAHLEPKED